MRRYLYIMVCCLAFFVPSSLSAQVLDSTLTVSLLTCSPGQLSYELYGHTALRVRSTQTGADYVFNYGAFDFNTPNSPCIIKPTQGDQYLYLILPVRLKA